MGMIPRGSLLLGRRKGNSAYIFVVMTECCAEADNIQQLRGNLSEVSYQPKFNADNLDGIGCRISEPSLAFQDLTLPPPSAKLEGAVPCSTEFQRGRATISISF
jgi:hypothetical protein